MKGRRADPNPKQVTPRGGPSTLRNPSPSPSPSPKQVTPRGGPPEVVSMLFCGTSEDPLLVQRIGRNREAAARAEEAAPTGAGALSGAAAAPSLGYAQVRGGVRLSNPNPYPNPNPNPNPNLTLTPTQTQT